MNHICTHALMHAHTHACMHTHTHSHTHTHAITICKNYIKNIFIASHVSRVSYLMEFLFLVLSVCVKYLYLFQPQSVTWLSDVCRPVTMCHHLTFKPKRVPRRRKCWPFASCVKWTKVPRWRCSSKHWTRSITTCWTVVRVARLTTCRDFMPGTPRKSHRWDLTHFPSAVFRDWSQ